MKKIYMSPVMDVIELINQQTLLAGSKMPKSDTDITNDGEILAPSIDSPDYELEF